MNTELAPVFELTFSEKLQLVEDLWDSIASTPEQIPVLNWQKEETCPKESSLSAKS